MLFENGQFLKVKTVEVSKLPQVSENIEVLHYSLNDVKDQQTLKSSKSFERKQKENPLMRSSMVRQFNTMV